MYELLLFILCLCVACIVSICFSIYDSIKISDLNKIIDNLRSENSYLREKISNVSYYLSDNDWDHEE